MKYCGILNITPDSFSDGNIATTDTALLQRSKYLVRRGCSILDIGAQSTRPGAPTLTPEVEILRYTKVLNTIRSYHLKEC